MSLDELTDKLIAEVSELHGKVASLPIEEKSKQMSDICEKFLAHIELTAQDAKTRIEEITDSNVLENLGYIQKVNKGLELFIASVDKLVSVELIDESFFGYIMSRANKIVPTMNVLLQYELKHLPKYLTPGKSAGRM